MAGKADVVVPYEGLEKEVNVDWAKRSCHQPWEVAGATADAIRDGSPIQVSRMGWWPRVVNAAARTALVSGGGWGEESAKDTTVRAIVR